MSSALIFKRVLSRCATLFPRGSSLCAAVSGGSDSTAMLHILHRFRRELGIGRLAVAHVNHRLRGRESEEDERFVAGLARSLEVPFFIKRLSGGSLHAAGMEAWARQERYAFFRALQEQERYEFIATGHTMDDQAETVLLRILRGCGLRGLRGILARRDDGVVRPVIDLTRIELLKWLGAAGLAYRSDRSNEDRAFARNRVRHEVLPLLERKEPGAAAKLAIAAGRAQEIGAMIQPSIDGWIASFAEKSAGRVVVRKTGLQDRFIAGEALRVILESCGIQADEQHLVQMLDSSERTSGQYLLPGGVWRWYCLRDAIELRCGASRPAARFACALKVPGVTDCAVAEARFSVECCNAQRIAIPRDNLTVALDRNACGDRLIFRAWRTDDLFTPLGGRRPVGVNAYLAKQKIPALLRRQMGVVEGKPGEIVWIPGVQISRRCAVTRKTRAVLKISYQSCPVNV